MKREEVKALLISMGVAEPTEEAITNYLNTIQKEVKTAEDRANRYKAEADRVKDLEKQLDTLNSQNLSDVEKANKATEDALNRVAELENTVKQMRLSKELAEIGIVGDDASGLFNEDGSLNVAKMGEIMTGREKSAVADYQKQALHDTPNPGGAGKESEGKEPEGKETNPLIDDVVKSVAATAKAKTDAISIIDSYK